MRPRFSRARSGQPLLGAENTLICSLHWSRLVKAALLAWLVVLPLAAQQPSGATIAGTVLDELGQPLAGATVVIRGDTPPMRREAQTDAAGRFSAAGFPAGGYHCLLLREGEIVWSFPLTLPPGQEILRLEIDLKKLREAAQKRLHLTPEIERQQEVEQKRQEHSDRLNGYYNRGARFLRDNLPREAVEEYRNAVLLEPENGTSYALLAAALAAAGRRDDAIDSYRRALELEANEAAHHNNLGSLLVRAGRLEDALLHFKKAALLDPERAATPQFNLGAALLNVGRVEEALPALRQAVRLDPTMAVAQFFLGTALFRVAEKQSSRPWSERPRERAEIVSAFQRYLQLEPEGVYVRQARDYLELLGVAPPPMLLPQVPPPEELP